MLPLSGFAMRISSVTTILGTALAAGAIALGAAGGCGKPGLEEVCDRACDCEGCDPDGEAVPRLRVPGVVPRAA